MANFLIQVKGILSRLGLHCFYLSDTQKRAGLKPRTPHTIHLNNKTKNGKDASVDSTFGGEILFDRRWSSASSCSRPLVKPFDIVTTLCLSFVGMSTSTIGTTTDRNQQRQHQHQ